MSNFYVKSYSKDRLAEIFSEESESPKYCVDQKKHLAYFDSYFNALEAKTVFVEKDYVDKDYLEDYSSYYVKSYRNYKRFCNRIHFFSCEFESEEFKTMLGNGKTDNLSVEKLQDSYLGFLVLKPLPQTIIGKSCLKTYHHINNEYSITRKYDVSLFGIHLEVDSIAYQEQDSIVAACASSALWSAFQWTGLFFQHKIQSPVEITLAAIKHFPYSNRHIPNKGLTSEQMAHAIRNVGLVPQIYDGQWKKEFDHNKAIIYAYLRAKIPIVLGVELQEYDKIEKIQNVGRHAITILGFSLNEDFKHQTGFKLLSSSMMKIYAHDDQIGPFARMEFDNKTGLLSTSWSDDGGNEGNIFASSLLLIVPLYNKIRIPFNKILKLINELDQTIKYVDSVVHFNLSDIVWDIFLTTTQKFKSEIFNSKELNPVEKVELLKMGLPKFMWRAIGRNGTDKIEFLFDATDLEQGDLLITMIPYSKPLAHIMRNLAVIFPEDKIKSFQLRKMLSTLKNS